MRKNYLLLMMLVATVGWGQTPALGDLRELDRRETKDKARKLIEEKLDEVFNFLIDKDLGDNQFKTTINTICNISGNQVFYQDNSTITNDYSSLLKGKKQVINEYFEGFKLMKKNTDDSRFIFKIDNIGELRQQGKGYLYLEVNYTLKFDGYYENRVPENGKLVTKKVMFEDQHKTAELHAEKIGKNWKLLITYIANDESKPITPKQPTIVKTEPKATVTPPVPAIKVDVAKPTETKVVAAPQTNPPKAAETKVATVQQTSPAKPIETKPTLTQMPIKPKDIPVYNRSKSGSGSALAKIAVAAVGLGAGFYGYSLNRTFQLAKADVETISGASGTQTVSSQNAAQYNAAYDKALAAQGKKGFSTAMLGVAGVAVLFEAYLLFKPSNNNVVGFKIQPASVGVGVGISYHF